jgi:hypothetical protein
MNGLVSGGQGKPCFESIARFQVRESHDYLHDLDCIFDVNDRGC